MCVFLYRSHGDIIVFKRSSDTFQSIKQVATYAVGSGAVAKGHSGRFEHSDTLTIMIGITFSSQDQISNCLFKYKVIKGAHLQVHIVFLYCDISML